MLRAFNNNIEMLIKFRDEKDILGLKMNLYRLLRRDKIEIDKILDSLIKNRYVKLVLLGQLLAVILLIFMIWSKSKPRLVINF